MQTFMFLALALVGVSAYKDYAGYQVLRAQPETPEQLAFLKELMKTHIFLTEGGVSMHFPTQIVVQGSERADLQQQLLGLGLESDITVEDLKPMIDESMRSMRDGRMDWKKYYSYQSIMDFLDEIESKTDGAELLTIGSTHEGRSVKVLHYNPGGSSKKVWIDGGTHALEWISPAVATYVLNEITTNYAANKELVDKYDWHVLPLLNPDGYVYSHSRRGNRLWRKNRVPNDGSPCLGVDLNRNWDHHWMEVGASSDPCDFQQNYGGPEAESELEVRAVRDYILSFDEAFTIFMTLHSFSQFWLCPWSWTHTLPSDYADLEAVLKPTVENITAVHGEKYDYGNVIPGHPYRASGTGMDWAKGVAKIKHSYTIELRPDSTRMFPGFLPPEQILPTATETWEGMKVAVELANA